MLRELSFYLGYCCIFSGVGGSSSEAHRQCYALLIATVHRFPCLTSFQHRPLSAKHPGLSTLQFVSVILLVGAVPQPLRDASSNIQFPGFKGAYRLWITMWSFHQTWGCLSSFAGLSFPDPCSFLSFQRHILHHTDCHWEAWPQRQIAALHSASSWRDSGWQLQDTQWYMLQKQGGNLCFLIEGYFRVCWKMVRKLSHQEPCTGDGI